MSVLTLTAVIWTALAALGAINHWRLYRRYETRRAFMRIHAINGYKIRLANRYVRTELVRLTIKVSWTALGLLVLFSGPVSEHHPWIGRLILIGSLLLLDYNSTMDVREADEIDRQAHDEAAIREQLTTEAALQTATATKETAKAAIRAADAIEHIAEDVMPQPPPRERET